MSPRVPVFSVLRCLLCFVIILCSSAGLPASRLLELFIFVYKDLAINIPEMSILLNIMFHALMRRFQLELFIFIAYFCTVVPLTSCFVFCRPFVVNATFSTGLVVFFCLLVWTFESFNHLKMLR